MVFRGDLLVQYLKTKVTLTNLFTGGIFFGTPWKMKDWFTLYIRAFDNPNGMNSRVRVECSIYWQQNTPDQLLLNAVDTLKDEFIGNCAWHHKPNLLPSVWYKIHDIKNSTMVWPDRDLDNNMQVIKKDFIFYYNENGL